MEKQIKCDNCGSVVRARRANKRFCGSKCRTEAHWRKKLGVAKTAPRGE